MVLQTISMQNDVIEWVRDHRVHHKYSDTDADPTNSKRGFFFAHMGWLMCKKHPNVREYGAKVDMSDIKNDAVLQFQRKFYIPMVLVLSFLIPMKLHVMVFNTTYLKAFYAICFRSALSFHLTWLVNSACHFGSCKPYDRNIAPSDSIFLGNALFGESWHNFHHTFPFDYKTSELRLYRYNYTLAFIDFFGWLGWATDFKVATDEMVRERAQKTGDKSHPSCKLVDTLSTE